MNDTPRRGRGRPRGTGKVGRADIVAGAVDALANGGYRALSMRGVARQLGVSLSSVQHHFPTKDDLWRAAVDRLTDEAIERRRHDDLRNLQGSIAAALKEQASRPGLIAALLTDTDVGSEERIAYLASCFTRMLAEPTTHLRALQRSGVVRPVDTSAFFALMTIGMGAIAGAGHAFEAIYGFDVTTDVGRDLLATELADILSLGLRER
ncbi:MAG: TetR/AcrR family transcriptional regulator [Actinomycetota bacterium]